MTTLKQKIIISLLIIIFVLLMITLYLIYDSWLSKGKINILDNFDNINTQPNTQINTQKNIQPNTTILNTQPNTTISNTQPNTTILNTQPNTTILNTQPNTTISNLKEIQEQTISILAQNQNKLKNIKLV